MRDDYKILVNTELAREMQLLMPKQPKAVELMHLFLTEMDENNQAILRFSYLRDALGLDMHPVLDVARAIEGMGWLDSIVYDTDVLFAIVNKDYARIPPEQD